MFSYSILWLYEEIFYVDISSFWNTCPFVHILLGTSVSETLRHQNQCIWLCCPSSGGTHLYWIWKLGICSVRRVLHSPPWSFEEEINWVPIWMGGISLSPSECLSVDQRSIWVACWDEPHHRKSSLSGLQAEAWLCLSAEASSSFHCWMSIISVFYQNSHLDQLVQIWYPPLKDPLVKNLDFLC